MTDGRFFFELNAMKKTHILATLLALLTLAGCEKVDDGVDGMVEIFAESMSGGKVLLDGANSTWVSGDQIRLNGTTATVTRRDDRAYISSDGLADVNRAVYPASLVGSDLTSNTVSIEFPRYYHYRTGDGGQQVLDLPMAAYSTGNNPLQFKHLTGALYITITNTASVPLTLQSVTVTSRTCMLNGSRSFDISNIENILPVNITASDEEKRSVSMLFDTGYTLAANESLRVMLPILPVDSANRFALKVKSYKQGEQQSYLLERWQPEGGNHSLARNVLGYAPIDIEASGTRTTLLEINNRDEYVIRTPYDFELMTKAIDNQCYADNAIYSILDDLDMTGRSVNTVLYNGFGGIIEGNGHTISNLTIKGRLDGSEYCCGLFKNSAYTIQNIVLSNVHLECQNVRNKPLYVGILGANITSSGTITVNNCSFSIGSFNRGENTGQVYFGGLVGADGSIMNISNCRVSTTTTSNIIIAGTTVYCGGLVGYMGSQTMTVRESSWDGTIEINAISNVYMGGLIGFKSSERLFATNCSISGSVAATTSETYYNRWLGQLVGRYNSPVATDTTGTTANISFTLNNEAIAPSNFGINR